MTGRANTDAATPDRVRSVRGLPAVADRHTPHVQKHNPRDARVLPVSCRRPAMSALEIAGLRKVYANGLEALKGVALTVQEGDFFALLGPNGAGKSTIIGIVSSLVNKTAGTVSIYGYDTETEPEMAKSCIGVVPQEFNFNMFEKVEDIVFNQAGYYGIPRKQATTQAEHYLRKLGLWEKRRERSRDLSGGMKRRLMIAGRWCTSHRLLILDEPTAGVDIEIRRSMWTFYARSTQAGTTIILTTHYLEEAESLCENIAIIDHGLIIEDTDMKSLLNKLHVETFVLDIRTPLSGVPEQTATQCVCAIRPPWRWTWTRTGV